VNWSWVLFVESQMRVITPDLVGKNPSELAIVQTETRVLAKKNPTIWTDPTSMVHQFTTQTPAKLKL